MSDSFIEKYELRDKINDGYIYENNSRNLWFTPQWPPSERTAEKRLQGHGYFEVKHTPGLFLP